jgi:hypothetical protein
MRAYGLDCRYLAGRLGLGLWCLEDTETVRSGAGTYVAVATENTFRYQRLDTVNLMNKVNLELLSS